MRAVGRGAEGESGRRGGGERERRTEGKRERERGEKASAATCAWYNLGDGHMGVHTKTLNFSTSVNIFITKCWGKWPQGSVLTYNADCYHVTHKHMMMKI